VHPLLIDVHGHGILGDIGIVQAVTVDVLPGGPGAQGTQVLAQAIDERRRVFQQRLPFAGVGSRSIHEPAGFDPKAQERAGQGAVIESVEPLGLQAHALAKIGIGGEYRRLPPDKMRFQPIA
jgi:hypothetical protein